MPDIVIHVSSASELSAEQRGKLERVFSAKHSGADVGFDYKIDKELIGGILVVDGDKYYDGTLRSQIDKLATDFKLNEKYVEAASTANSKRKKNKKASHTETVTYDDGVAPQIAQDTAEYIKLATDRDLAKTVKKYRRSFDVRHAGSVEFCGDGVIVCTGLSDAEYGEMLQIENGTQAIVLSLSDDSVGAIVLDDDDKVSAHMVVKTTGMIVSVPVGEKLLGRVVNPLGKPIDGAGSIIPDKFRPIEAHAPAIKDRAKVNEPMMTGLVTDRKSVV